MSQEQKQITDRLVEVGMDGLQGFDRHLHYADTIRKMMKIATGEKL